MSKVLTAYGTSGLVAIHEPNADLSDPLNSQHNIYFHSDLDYLKIVNTITGVLSLPTRTYSSSDASSSYGNVITNVYTHNLGYTPLVLAFNTDNNQPLVGDSLVQSGGTCNLRSILVGADSTYVYIRELYLNKDTTYQALTINYKIHLFNESGD